MKLADLGQAPLDMVQGALPETTLAPRRNTVDLDAPRWPVYAAWALVAGLAVYTLNRMGVYGPPSRGPDAADELAAEAARIRARVAARRA